MKTQTDVVIIGAGVIGVCTAHALAGTGRRVVVLDRDDVCSGSSYGNAGLVVPSHCAPLAEPGVVAQGLRWLFNPDSPFYIKPRIDRDLFSWLWTFRKSCTPEHVARSRPLLRDLHLASLDLYRKLASDEGLDFGFEQRGALHVCRTDAGFRRETEGGGLAGEAGIQVEVLTEEGVRARVPGMRLDVTGGIFYPQDAHLRPADFVRGLAARVVETGVDVRTHTEVLSLERSGDRIAAVRTTRGDFEAGEVVLAGGASSPVVVRDMGLKLPIQAAKGYSITVRRPDGVPEVPLLLSEAKVAVTPMGETLRFAGTLELSGLDMTVNLRRVEAIVKAVPRYLPDLKPDRLDVIEIWRGLRPCTPDGLPYLGRARRFRNLTVGAGHGMIGMSLGPISGRILSRIVQGVEPGFDLSATDPERFG